MNGLHQGAILAMTAFLVLVAPHSFAGGCLQRNPPGGTDGDASQPCGCQIGGDSVGADCIKVLLGLGRTTPWTRSREVTLKVFADDDSPLVFTPDSLYPVVGYTFKRLGGAMMTDGVTPKDVIFSHPNGESVKFVFAEGESLGRPDPGVHVPMDERLQMVDALGWATTHDPVYWDLYESDGTVRRFLASDQTGRRGSLVSETDSRGIVTTPEDMGIDIVYGPDGVRQFLSPSRLADVLTVSDGYDVNVYALAEVPAKDSASGLYALPADAPCRRLSVRSSHGGRRAVVTLQSGEDEPKTYRFDYVSGDWSLVRPSGVSELKSRYVIDCQYARLTKDVRSPDDELISREVMNYQWCSWGFAMTNKVEGFGDAVRTTEWSYYPSGNGQGKVRHSLTSAGLKTDYRYDSEGRKITVTRSGPDMMTEVTTYDYATVDPMDVVPPVDSRPRTVVKTLGGVECERTYYVYSPLTNIVERARAQGASYGGTNALRTVTAYYPVVSGDIRSGRVKSVRHEDGRLDLYDYVLVTNVWTETVTHVHEQTPVSVDGKTLRDVLVTNRRGEVVERRVEVFVGGSWRAISCERRAYDGQGRAVRTEDLAGRVTTTEWDCCHKTAETKPDGQVTTWDYDDEGRTIASSRLIPLDLTNVTWVTTCYSYDGLGRQTAVWTTNFAAQVGLPVTATAYDALGRVVTRTDVLGNVTATDYSADGLTVSVTNPNGSTSVAVRNAAGELLALTGTAVTPEFRTCGITPDGMRWTKTVQGESPDSPRFVKRYENPLGEIVRVEKSGFRGAVLTTVNEYDGLGRLARTVSDGEPMTEHVYDAFGVRIATVHSVDGEWRRNETQLAYGFADDAVWQTQTNITSCSDAAIAPLVASQLIQLSGLTAAMIARTRTTDLRGNPTEVWTEYADGVTTEKRRVPEATNIAGSRSRFGMSLESVSVSAVTNRTVYDALGRVVAAIDGRGNAVRTEYDTFGRRAESFDGAGNPTRYAYDRYGRLAAVTNALGNAVVYEYDLRGRKTYEGGATYPVRYTYDVFGNKTTMMTYRDESLGLNSGDVTTWLYDEASGVMTNKVYADGKGPRYDYDAIGRLAKRTWARGIDTFYAYDGWGNLTNTTYSDETPTVAIKYDALGRQIATHDAAGVTTFAYDAFGANTNETVVGVAGTNVLERFTDEFGRDAGYALNGERRTIIGHDLATRRIATMQIPAREGETDHSTPTPSTYTSFCWSYHPGCDLKHTLRYPNGALVTWGYEPHRDLMTLVSNDVYSTFRYTYDDAGKRVSKNDERYGYNARGELVLATNIVTGAEFAYCYDDIGNRRWSREFGTNCTYVANELNQYTNIIRGGVFEFSAFDLDGNQTNIVTSTGEWLVEYNGENRPVMWSRASDGTAIRMAYDRMGRRVVKNNETFVYDGYLNVGNTIWDPTEPIATRPLVWTHYTSARNGSFFYTHDGNKNVSGVIAPDGKIAAEYEFAAFGSLVAKCGDFVLLNPWRFSSEFADDNTAAVYYNYRHYGPAMGRWLQRDPIGELDSVVLFLLSDNSPNISSDMLGLIDYGKVCRDAIGNAWDKKDSPLKSWFKRNAPKGCPMPRVVCGCCDKGTEGFMPAGTTKHVSQGNSEIKICQNKVNGNETAIGETLKHELFHAIDYCKTKRIFTCEEEICSEVKAYSGADCANLSEGLKKECVKKGAKMSSRRFAPCRNHNIDRLVDDAVDNGACK